MVSLKCFKNGWLVCYVVKILSSLAYSHMPTYATTIAPHPGVMKPRYSVRPLPRLSRNHLSSGHLQHLQISSAPPRETCKRGCICIYKNLHPINNHQGCIWSCLLRGPSQGYHHFPYEDRIPEYDLEISYTAYLIWCQRTYRRISIYRFSSNSR